MSTPQTKNVFWSFSTIQSISEKISHSEPLSWKETILWNYYKITDHPRPRGNVKIVASAAELDAIIDTNKPVAVAFTAPYKYTCEHLKKKIREIAPYFDDAEFVEVDCSLTPKICYERNIVSVPAIDVFYKPPGETRTKRFRYGYSYSVYGFHTFLKEYNLRDINSPSVFSIMASKLDSLKNLQSKS